MAGWGNAKKAAGGGSITRINLSKDVTPNNDLKVRIVGKYIARYIYWLTLNDGNKRTVECLAFNRQSESFDNEAGDPLSGKHDQKGDEFKPQFSYVVQCIDRADGQVKIMELKKTVFNEMVALAQHKDYGDFTDPATGFDLTISKEKTGPLPINVKYKLLAARSNSPLTAEEKALTLYDLDKLYPRPELKPQIEFLRENTDLLDGESDAPTDGEISDGADDVPNDIKL